MPQKTNGAKPIQDTTLQAPPIPQKLEWLVERMVAAIIFDDGQHFQYCIVNEYTGHQSLGSVCCQLATFASMSW